MSERPIILFDGVCNLCNGFVQFVIDHDKNSQFRFASLQSAAGAHFLEKHQLPPDQLSTIVLSEGSAFYTKSGAVLRIASRFGGPWKLLSVFLLLPSFLRNAAYDFVAKHRYRFFGKKDACMIPTPELRERFL